ncbi:MAG: SWIM zinc finger family protein, partial [Kineosporiaceae bacterium]
MSPFDRRSRGFFPPSRPITAEGGIKARSTRGAIGSSWWSRRFIDALESLAVGGRLARGRTYARAGQVLSLELSAGLVRARVQGSRPTPYRVSLAVKPFSEPVWSTVEAALAEQAIYSAHLLAGAMPPDIDEVFAAAGAPLFPARRGDLTMACSCPDWEVPCKHLAATIYLLGERFDADPFEILAWRGRDRQTLLAHLRDLRGAEPEPEGLA